MTMDYGAEKWRPIPGFAGKYEVSDLGRVRSATRMVRSSRGTRTLVGRVMSQSKDRNGYPRVVLRVDGRSYNRRIHRLVAAAFHGHLQNALHREVDHIDRNIANSRADNLRWVSPRENALNRKRPGGQHKARLTPEVVAYIRLGKANAKATAAQLGFSPYTIYDVRRQMPRRWLERACEPQS